MNDGNKKERTFIVLPFFLWGSFKTSQYYYYLIMLLLEHYPY